MSSFSNPPGTNRYNAPQNWQSPNYAPALLKQLPTFCTVMFIIDLVLMVFRIAMVMLGFVGYFMLKERDPNNPMFQTAMFEILTGIAMVITGLPANVGRLMKQRWGVFAAYLACLATIASMIVGFWQLSVTVQAAPLGPDRAAVLVGAVFAVVVRLAILGAYFAAVYMFSSWKNDPQRVAAENNPTWSPPAY